MEHILALHTIGVYYGVLQSALNVYAVYGGLWVSMDVYGDSVALRSVTDSLSGYVDRVTLRNSR